MATAAIYFLNFWHVFLLFAILQAILLCLVLVDRSRKHRTANRLLAVFLICVAMVLTEYVSFDSGVFGIAPYLIGSSLPFLFLLGPMFYLYSKSLFRANLQPRHSLHLIPCGISILSLLPFYLQSGEEKIGLVTEFMQNGFQIFPTFQFMLVSLASFHMIVYFYSSYDFLRKYEQAVVEEYTSARIYTITWIKQLAIGFNFFMVAFFLAWSEIILMENQDPVFIKPMIGILACFVFVTAVLIHRRAELFAEYTPGTLPNPDEMASSGIKLKYQKNVIAEVILKEYDLRLEAHMAREKPFLDGELRLRNLASSLDMPPHHLSQLINGVKGVSFFDYVNQHRVSYAQQLLRSGSTKDSIIEVALNSGFNSKASFNRAFKKMAGLTPSEFKKAQQFS